MTYCCEEMEFADKEGFIDYCGEDFSTTIEYTAKDGTASCIGINFCPFCGKEMHGTNKLKDIMTDLIEKNRVEGKTKTGNKVAKLKCTPRYCNEIDKKGDQ